jgi:hypothetical protein
MTLCTVIYAGSVEAQAKLRAAEELKLDPTGGAFPQY